MSIDDHYTLAQEYPGRENYVGWFVYIIDTLCIPGTKCDDISSVTYSCENCLEETFKDYCHQASASKYAKRRPLLRRRNN